MTIFSISIVRYFLVAGIPFFLFYRLLEIRFLSSKIQRSKAARKDFFREIIHSLQTTIVFTLIGYIILYTPVIKITQVYANVNYYPIWWIPVSLVLCLIVHDTYFYWMHRVLHHPKIFRYTHLLHHRSTNPSPWASYSFSIAEAFAEGLVLFIITIIMPLHTITLTLFVVVGFMINVYGHLGYEIVPQGFRNTLLFKITNTSVFHNLHHRKFKGNYGLYFRFWDHMMGTEHVDYVKEFDKIQQSRFYENEANKNIGNTV